MRPPKGCRPGASASPSVPPPSNYPPFSQEPDVGARDDEHGHEYEHAESHRVTGVKVREALLVGIEADGLRRRSGASLCEHVDRVENPVDVHRPEQQHDKYLWHQDGDRYRPEDAGLPSTVDAGCLV